MPALRTLQTFVNTWECDENDHMNVQFYYSKFDDAALVFQTLLGLDEQLGPRARRHVRYHAELRGGEQVAIQSSLVSSDDSGTVLQHIMIETHSGRLAATAIDYYSEQTVGEFSDVTEPLDPRAVSRSLLHVLKDTDITRQEREEQGFPVTSRGVVRAEHCGKDGVARDQAYISCVSDAASHAWELVGLSGGWLGERGFGRVAVEMRLSVFEPLMLGDVFELRTSFIASRSKSFSKRYDIFNLKTGKLCAVNEATAMILNHTTRKSEAIPSFAQEAIRALSSSNIDA